MTAQTNTPGPLGLLIHEVAKLMKRRFDVLAREHGLTLPQWRTLSQLMRNETLSQVALAGAVDTDPMTMSGILDRLETRGLIERLPDPADSRAKVTRLTPEGRAVTEEAKSLGRQLFEHALDGVTEEDRETVIRALTCIRTNLSEATVASKELA
jgi:MarR family transcriptional regulator, transcriptional regulator for hemolysin